MEIVLGVVAVVALLTWAMWAYAGRRRGEITATLTSIDDFIASETFSGADSGLAYDASRRRLKVSVRRGSTIQSAFLDSEDLVEAKLNDSGTVLAYTGGGLIGGVVGGFGLGVVGGKRAKMSVSVSLQLVVRDADNPSWVVTFAELGEASSDFAGPIRSAALVEGRKWYGIVASMIEFARGAGTPTEPTVSESHTVAEQLRQLADLQERGYLSHDEFKSAKKRILGTPQ